MDMNNLISIIEIPTADIARATKFYEAILEMTPEKAEIGEDKLAMFPNDGKSISVQLINGKDYKPSADGTTIYLNAGDDLQIVADKIEKNGGSVVVPKTEIPEMGFFAIFMDTEGNKLGLFSNN